MKKTIKISGMHCISCEMLLEKAFKNMEWIKVVSINHKKWILELDISDNSQYEKVEKIIEENNFKIDILWNKKGLDQTKILNNIIALLVLILLGIIAYITDIYRYLPDSETLSFGGVFLIGIIASLSTCLAITGGIIIWFSRYIDSTRWLASHMQVQWMFHFWRILGFFLLWWLLGSIWNIFSINSSINGILNIMIWFLLLYMWLNILGILPSITKFGVHMPKRFAAKIEKITSPSMAPIVWTLTFFLPCWFTQAIQLMAMSSWNFLTWGLLMMFFAIGTMPVLFSVWVGSSYFRDKNFQILNTIIWWIVVFFWVFSMTNAYNLISINSTDDNKQISTSNTWTLENEIEVINIWHNWWSTDPKEIYLETGKNYKLIITPTSDGKGCMTTQVIPKLNTAVSYNKKWIPIEYNFNNLAPWKYPIVCSAMGMKQWTIVVK